jgi:hypothetical protein
MNLPQRGTGAASEQAVIVPKGIHQLGLTLFRLRPLRGLYIGHIPDRLDAGLFARHNSSTKPAPALSSGRAPAVCSFGSLNVFVLDLA